MSGFEPLFMAAAEAAPEVAAATETILPTVIENAGTTALMGEVMGLPSLGASIAPTAMNGLAQLSTIAPEVTQASISAVAPSLEGLSQVQGAQLLNQALPGQLSQTEIANLVKGVNTPVTELGQIADASSKYLPEAAKGMQLPQTLETATGPSPLENWQAQQAAGSPTAQSIQAANAEPYTNPSPLEQYKEARAASSEPFVSSAPGATTTAGGGGLDNLLQSIKGFGSDLYKEWEDLKPSKKLLYGAGAGLAANALFGKKPSVPTEEKYSGPLSKFHYNKDVYQPYIAAPPTPYTPQYTDYRRYAGGGPIEAMSNANAIGANTGYPMADIHKGAYATPWQTPISSNVLEGTADTGVNPMTGEMSFARGGISDLGGYSDGGRMLKGPGDGMSDNIPATIAGKQPARLANEEFVIPADVVSHLGNGSSDAGAKQLYKMMDRVRQARTGTKKQGRQINPEKYLA